MTTYSDVWDTMNELDMMTSKLGYIKEMMETALEYLDNHDKTRAESLMYVSCDYIKYYLDEYDRNFRCAWATTTQAGKELDDVREKLSRLENQENPQHIDDCMPPWGHSDMEAMKYTNEKLEAMSNHSSYYYDYTRNDNNRKNPFDVTL